MSEKESQVSNLNNFLGFDPLKEEVNQGVLKEVIQELNEERQVQTKAKVKEQLTKAMEIAATINKLKKDFEKQIAEHEKKLGNLLKSINGNAQNNQLGKENTEQSE